MQKLTLTERQSKIVEIFTVAVDGNDDPEVGARAVVMEMPNANRSEIAAALKRSSERDLAEAGSLQKYFRAKAAQR